MCFYLMNAFSCQDQLLLNSNMKIKILALRHMQTVNLIFCQQKNLEIVFLSLLLKVYIYIYI